jgi:hypothetical protein
MRPFRFGVNVRDARSRADWQDKARRVEGLGYAVFLVPDHLAAMLATVPAVMSAADATTRLRVGTNVLNNDLRHPVLVAREAATLDLLTDVRLELGWARATCASSTTRPGSASTGAASGSSGSPSRWRSSRACSAAPRSPSPATTTT